MRDLGVVGLWHPQEMLEPTSLRIRRGDCAWNPMRGWMRVQLSCTLAV